MPKNKIGKKPLKKIGRTPRVSVILPVYNAASFLEEALDSILKQNYKYFEIVAVDDASNDGSFAILKKYANQNPRIRVFRNRKNLGVSMTARKAIEKSRSKYLARMDADDIMPPYRLSKQLKYLENRRRVVAVGGQAILIDSKNNIIGKKAFPLEFKKIKKYIFHFVPLQQPSMMIARHRLPANFEYYRDGMNTAEEIELFFKLFEHGRVENMPDVLLLYRMHDDNTSLKNVRVTFLLTLLARIRAILKYNYSPSFEGIFITFVQTILILVLPQKFTLVLYQIAREISMGNAPSLLRFNKISPKALLSS